ncbi:MAG: DUF3054 domain-containing protein [Propionibacteriaceae bacterium]|nr:DUF3054 domain-containing protein [Propionibacteriaceae bacterium]
MKAVLAFLCDLWLVLMFVTMSRLSHNQVIDVAGVTGTAWPFAAGLVLGWLITRSWRTTLTFPAALGVFVCTLAVGIAFRHLTFTGAQPSFVAMSFSVLSVLLMGWRLIVYLELNRRTSVTT